jgi:hypothetical protein
MPTIRLKRDPDLMPDSVLEPLLEKLPGIVASALHVEGNRHGRLQPDDIDIEVSDHGRLDVNCQTLQILILANDYPERAANINERTKEIADAVRFELRMFRDVLGIAGRSFVWVFLGRAGFVPI